MSVLLDVNSGKCVVLFTSNSLKMSVLFDNNVKSGKVCINVYHSWLQSSWKLFEAYIWDGSEQEIWFQVGLCTSQRGTKSHLKRHYWDFSNVFSGGTLYLSASYSFEFSQLNSLLSCMGLKSQDKIKRWKSLELSMDLWHVLVDCVPFLYWFFQYCLQ